MAGNRGSPAALAGLAAAALFAAGCGGGGGKTVPIHVIAYLGVGANMPGASRLGREPGEPEPQGRYVPPVEEIDQGLRVRELEQTVAAMREALELRDRDAAEQVQREIADAAAETEQLKATIRALRDELEAQRQAHAAAIQDAERLRRDGLRELQDTIQTLRAKLEESAHG